MRIYSHLLFWGIILPLGPTTLTAATGPVFYGDPPDEHHPWAVHDRNRPQPKVVEPGTFSSQEKAGQPPSDAVVLFDGTDLSQWESTRRGGGPAKWLVQEGYMQVKPGTGAIRTKEKFGDCQLHIEWAAPSEVKGSDQGRGNSGVFLMDRLEIQVLDSYNNTTYADGHAGAYYGINPPMALPLNPPGKFQVYDILFRRPIYKDGQAVDPGYVTVFLNGVMVQDHTMIEGPGGHRGRTRPGPFPEVGPIQLQDHGNPTRFRNIWYRPLPPRPAEGGTDGWLTTEAAMAKRKEIAASIRKRAAKERATPNPMPQLVLWMESLVYEKDEATLAKVEQMAGQYVASLQKLPADQLATKENEAKQFRGSLQYLAKFKIIPGDFGPKVGIEKLIAAQGWDEKK